MEGLGVAANVIAVVDIAFKVTAWCAQYAKDVKNASKDIERLRKEVASFQAVAEQVQRLIEAPGSTELIASRQLTGAVEDGLSTLHRLAKELEFSTSRKAMSRFGLRALKWPFGKQEVEDTIQSLARCRGNISLALNVDVVNITQHTDLVITLDKLPVAAGAAFDSYAEGNNPTCLQNTRVDLLKRITTWINDPNAKTIFWLNGKAGTGKSTIARTIARERTSYGDLGASFFFKRGEPDRGNMEKLVPTLAKQLAKKIPSTAHIIKNMIDTDPEIIDKNVREQFDKLIRDPLSKAAHAIKHPSIVIVIDALDECERDDDAKLLIAIFSHMKILRPRLRILLTSRPELPIRLGFERARGTYEHIVLDQVVKETVRHDISLFLAEEFSKIRDDWNDTVGGERKLPHDWPHQQALEDLTNMAIPLFIFAATICRFIGDQRCKNPSKRLQEVLDHNRKSHSDQLDRTYGPVLKSQLAGASRSDQKHIIKTFCIVVGSIVMLASPLSVAALSRLLDIDPNLVDLRLDALHSVLSVPPTRHVPVRLLHLSFRDYLVDTELKGENQFWVDELSTHQHLARHCLRVMDGVLKQNICGLSFPGARRSTIDELELEKCLSSAIQYACLYWVYHQAATQPENADVQQVTVFLKTHLLHWFEAMSLMGRIGEGLTMLRTLAAWLEEANALPGKLRDVIDHQQQYDGSELLDLIHDAIRFVKINISIIDEAPLQIYSSAIIFAPSKTIVRRLFEQDVPSWLSVWPETEEVWDACLSVMEGHDDYIWSLAFSHDSRRIASASEDKTIRIWNVETGNCEQILSGHGGGVLSLTYSHDSKIIASGGYDKTIRIWRVDLGKCEKVLAGHDDRVLSVVFSGDSTKLASTSVDRTVRIWDVGNGRCEQVLRDDGHWISSVAFSHDSKMVVSTSHDDDDNGMLRIWDVKTGKRKHEFASDDDPVLCAMFSADSNTVLSVSKNNVLQIWNTETGDIEREYKFQGEPFISAAFSKDLKMVALTSFDLSTLIYNVETGECQQVPRREISGQVLAFSPDSKIIAIVLENTIQIWMIGATNYEKRIAYHSDMIDDVKFSPNSRMVATASTDSTARVWSTDTGKCEQVLEGHSEAVHDVVFSHDSKMVATASYDNTARIWSVDTGMCEQVLEGHREAVCDVVFSHDSRIVATASHDKTARIWSADTGKCEQVLEGHSGIVYGVAFSRNSKMVVTTYTDETARVWVVETGECKKVIPWNWLIDTPPLFTADDRGLITDQGIVPLVNEPLLSTEPPSLKITPVLRLGLRDRTWITLGGEDLLWLPSDCRQSRAAISDNAVAVGCSSGRFIFVGFSAAELVKMP